MWNSIVSVPDCFLFIYFNTVNILFKNAIDVILILHSLPFSDISDSIQNSVI